MGRKSKFGFQLWKPKVRLWTRTSYRGEEGAWESPVETRETLDFATMKPNTWVECITNCGGGEGKELGKGQWVSGLHYEAG
jgi:hypothetical protein